MKMLPIGTKVKISQPILTCDRDILGEIATILNYGDSSESYHLDFDKDELNGNHGIDIEWYGEEFEVINEDGGPSSPEASSRRHRSEAGDAPQCGEAGASAGLLSQGS